jgi:hypothetical protein
VWDRLRKQVAVEQESLRHLIHSFRPLLEEVQAGRHPTYFELNALASFLQAFYNGIENILKRISQLVDGGTPRGESWHADLLGGMGTANENRPAVISDGLREKLHQYMRFRHLYRHGYGFQLEWKPMAGLVKDSEKCLREFEFELEAFLRAGEEAEE